MSRRPLPERFWNKVRKSDGCWTWTDALTQDGYGRFWVPSRGRATMAHRYSLELALGRELAKHECSCHRCDNPPCVRPDHLFVGTPRENILDAHAKGRRLPGQGNPNAKLTNEDVFAIRAAIAAGGESLAAIGRRYGVLDTTIWNIARGRSWRHLKGPTP